MNKILLCSFLAFFLLFVGKQVQGQEDLSSYESLTLDMTIAGILTREEVQEHAFIRSLTARVSIVPETTAGQEVVEITTTPRAQKENNTLLFTWQNPQEDVSFEISARINTTVHQVAVNEKVPFPLKEIDNRVIKEYLEETAMIDYSNPSIRALAAELTAGEDDVYAVAVKIANWVQQNISYNLTTLTVDATQSASWVLENKYGVCDELTNLYIALLRAAGIPARFVIGISYTNSPLFEKPWNIHGWAEVYIPEYGWIPFDVTYGQYGFVDATHIQLSVGKDSEQASITYEWKGSNIMIRGDEVELNVTIESYGETAILPVVMTGTVYKEEVAFGSFNSITATIKSTEAYYIPLTIGIAFPKELTLLTPQEKTVLLEPKKDLKVFWMLGVPENLDPNYEYKFPIQIYTRNNKSVEIIFRAKDEGMAISRVTIDKILEQQSKEEGIYKKTVHYCRVNPAIFYFEKKPSIICQIKNIGYAPQEVEFCFEEACQNISLNVSKEKILSLDIGETKPGTYVKIIEIKNEDENEVLDIEYTLLDIPAIKISNISYEKEVRWNTELPLSFILEKASFQTPQNIVIEIGYGNVKQELKIERLAQGSWAQITEVLQTKNFREEQTPVKIVLTYEDYFGEVWIEEKTIVITLVDLSPWEKIKLFFRQILDYEYY